MGSGRERLNADLERRVEERTSALREHLQERELLLAELNHRVKNTLATVQSITRRTLGDGATEDEARHALEGRLRALAQTHVLLADRSWETVELKMVVAAQLASYGKRMTMQGPDLHLTSRAAVTLGLTLHELATNAAKHGALSTKRGRVSIAWDRGVQDGEPVLRLAWRESGGPQVPPPAKRGFGRALVERGVAYDLSGEARLLFAPSGVRCEIVVPAAEALA